MSDRLYPNRKPRDDELDVHGVSHAGNVPSDNQDHFLIATFHRRINVLGTNLPDVARRLPSGEQRLAYVVMVADGVGGGADGAEASATALEAAVRCVNGSVAIYYGADANEDEFKALLQEAATRAHEAVRSVRQEHGVQSTMATTLTLYIGVWPTYYLLQIGDSRYYVWRDGTLMQMTRDQTLAQDLVDQGAMMSDIASRTPMAHVLSSALGGDTTVPVVTRLPFHWGNVHLLCTDGLTKHVTDERIAEVLGSMTSARQAAEQLVQDALEGGGTDNVTVVVSRSMPREALRVP